MEVDGPARPVRERDRSAQADLHDEERERRCGRQHEVAPLGSAQPRREERRREQRERDEHGCVVRERVLAGHDDDRDGRGGADGEEPEPGARSAHCCSLTFSRTSRSGR